MVQIHEDFTYNLCDITLPIIHSHFLIELTRDTFHNSFYIQFSRTSHW